MRQLLLVPSSLTPPPPHTHTHHTRTHTPPRSQVRRTLAHSLHEFAKILGPELAETELLDTFDLFMQDLDEVKIGVVRSLAPFLSALSPACRESYLPIMSDVNTGTPEMQWRFRLALASQLPQLSRIFSVTATFSVVVPVVFHMLKDSISTVRRAAFATVGELIRRLGRDGERAWRDDFIARIVEFARAPSYRERLEYVQVRVGLRGGSATVALAAAAAAAVAAAAAAVFVPPSPTHSPIHKPILSHPVDLRSPRPPAAPRRIPPLLRRPAAGAGRGQGQQR